ncbi:MMPL family transporter [Streptomyces sp. L7]
MPSIKVVPANDSSRQGLTLVQKSFGKGAPGMLQVAVPDTSVTAALTALKSADGIAGVLPARRAADGSGWNLIQAMPSVDPSDPSPARTVSTVRTELPADALVGGAAVETPRPQAGPRRQGAAGHRGHPGARLPPAAGRAPGPTGRRHRRTDEPARDRRRLRRRQADLPGRPSSGLLGFEPQGFLDGWGPVFFFAMIFAIAMDYTVFLLSSAKEHHERTGDPKQAVVGALAHSGRVVFAAAAVMVAVFFTFALAGSTAGPRKWASSSASRSCSTPSPSGFSCSRSCPA